jgi:hypothetical protein
LIVAVALTLANCQCGKDARPQSGSASGSGSGSSSPTKVVNGSGSGSGSGKAVSTVIELPPLSGKPPAKTTKPHDDKQLEALSKLEFKGFTRDVRKLEKGFLTVKQKTDTRPKISITITILPCKDCLPIDLEKWKAAKGEPLKQLLPPELRAAKDTTFEFGEATLAGVKVIWTYQLGYFFGKDDQGNPTGTYANSYAIHYSDGQNQMRVVGEYTDDPLGSKDDLARAVPREQLEKVTKAFTDAYAQQWGN